MGSWTREKRGTVRRYVHKSGALLVLGGRFWAAVSPAWCRHISKAVTRAEAARILKEGRANG